MSARAAIAVGLCAALAGCASWEAPRIDPSGQAIFLPPGAPSTPAVAAATVDPFQQSRTPVTAGRPISPAPAPSNATIVVAQRELVAPVGSEVIVNAQVRSADGRPLGGQRVQWSMSAESVGGFVDVRERDEFAKVRPKLPEKIDNHFAISASEQNGYTVPRKSSQLKVQPGQAWVSLSSKSEGTSTVNVHLGSDASDNQQATTVIRWVDAQWLITPELGNPEGEKQQLTTFVSKRTTGEPLAGWRVRYEIVDGPNAVLGAGKGQNVEVLTDELGHATVEIDQIRPEQGDSQIRVQIIRPPAAGEPESRAMLIGSSAITKTWTPRQIAMRLVGPRQASKGEPITCRIEVKNLSDLPVRDIDLAGRIPRGLELLNSEPVSRSVENLQWRILELRPRESRTIPFTVRADDYGMFQLCTALQSRDGLRAVDCLAMSVVPQRLKIAIEGPDSGEVGEEVRYQVTISNSSGAPAENLRLRSTFAEGLQHLVAESPIERDLNDLAPGDSQTVFLSYTVAHPGTHCQTVEVWCEQQVVATAEGCIIIPGPVIESPHIIPAPAPPILPTEPHAEPEARPKPRPKLEVAVEGPRQKRVGETAEFMITVQNSGTEPLTNLRVVDTFASALYPTLADEGFTVGERRESLSWKRQKLAAGETMKLELHCRCDSATTNACNRVSVTADGQGPVADEVCLTILEKDQPPAEVRPPTPMPPMATPRPKLEIEFFETNDPIRVGGKTSYEVQITNTGEAAATEVQLRLTFPKQLKPNEFGMQRPVRKYSLRGDTIVFDPFAELRPKQTIKFVVPADAIDSAKGVRVSAEVTSATVAAPVRATEATDILPP